MSVFSTTKKNTAEYTYSANNVCSRPVRHPIKRPINFIGCSPLSSFLNAKSSKKLLSPCLLAYCYKCSFWIKNWKISLIPSSNNEDFLESNFPHCIIKRMPPYMSNVLAVSKNNTIQCSFCSESLLCFIGGMAMRDSYICLCARHDSLEDRFIDECMGVVCCS